MTTVASLSGAEDRTGYWKLRIFDSVSGSRTASNVPKFMPLFFIVLMLVGPRAALFYIVGHVDQRNAAFVPSFSLELMHRRKRRKGCSHVSSAFSNKRGE